MKLSRFVQRSKPSPLHSSGIVQGAERMGAASTDPFSKRLQREKSRSMIGSYRDAKVLQQSRDDNRDKSPIPRRDPSSAPVDSAPAIANDLRRSSRIDIVRPASLRNSPASPSSSLQSQRHSFREPPSRHRP